MQLKKDVIEEKKKDLFNIQKTWKEANVNNLQFNIRFFYY